MFTGIVEELGQVEDVRRGPESVVLRVKAPGVLIGLAPGDSVAVDGVCLTVTAHDGVAFEADVMLETLQRSTLDSLAPGSTVNLERAMRADGRFGGHIVQGHVDGTADCLARRAGDGWDVVTFSLPPSLAPFVVHKGSICLDGVSLTVSGLAEDRFEVSLIPTTLAATTLGTLAVGDAVNVEVDVIAKYVERLLSPRTTEARAAGVIS